MYTCISWKCVVFSTLLMTSFHLYLFLTFPFLCSGSISYKFTDFLDGLQCNHHPSHPATAILTIISIAWQQTSNSPDQFAIFPLPTFLSSLVHQSITSSTAECCLHHLASTVLLGVCGMAPRTGWGHSEDWDHPRHLARKPCRAAWLLLLPNSEIIHNLVKRFCILRFQFKKHQYQLESRNIFRRLANESYISGKFIRLYVLVFAYLVFVEKTRSKSCYAGNNFYMFAWNWAPV